MALRKTLYYTLGTAICLYVVIQLLVFFSQRWLTFQGAGDRANTSPPNVSGIEVLRIPTAVGVIEALLLPAIAPSSNVQQPIVIFAHGNGDVTDDWVSALIGFRERGIGVLLVEYPGYGRSTGEPSERSIEVAMLAAYDHIASDPRVDRTRIFGFGQSLGGGAISSLADKRPLKALILLSSFPSQEIFLSRYWSPSFLLLDRFDSLSVLQRFMGAVLVIHGRDDPQVPWQEAQRLSQASSHGVFKLYSCGHGCWDPNRLPFWQDVEPFLSQAGLLPLPTSKPISDAELLN